MQNRRFIQCDVFTNQPTKGNGLAVVVDGDGLSDTQMQDFAAWTNLAETTFLVTPTDPQADYRVRIFTPTREMLFAGHPTLGSCAAWLYCGGQPKINGMVKQECGVGLIEIDISADVPAFVAPPTKIEALGDAAFQSIIKVLDINPDDIIRSARLENGPVWQAFELKNAEAVLALDAALVRWPEYKALGFIGAYPEGSSCQYEVRMLAPSSGMSEDPITGSLNSALAHWMISEGCLSDDTLVAQGTKINRMGRIYIKPDKQDNTRVLIGGETQILIEGLVRL